MGKVTQIELTEKQRQALEKGYREGKKHGYRKRCQLILLKSERRSSEQVAGILGICEIAVNNWVKRYLAEGIQGLETRKGRGRKPVLEKEVDFERVREAVKANRQRIELAREELQTSLGKQFSAMTLKRFLKKTIAATNELDGG
jgi:transposase